MAHRHGGASKQTSLALVLLAYAAALGASIAVGYLVHDDLASNVPLLLAMIGFGVATTTVWLSSLLANNSSMYDAFWSVAPQAAANYWAIATYLDGRAVDTTRMVFILVAVNLWSLRLTINWLRAFPGLHHEDWRYLNIKRAMLGETPSLLRKTYYWVCGSLLGLHLFPSIETFLASTPSKLRPLERLHQWISQ